MQLTAKSKIDAALSGLLVEMVAPQETAMRLAKRRDRILLGSSRLEGDGITVYYFRH